MRAEETALTLGEEGRGIGLSAKRFDAFRPEDEDGNPMAEALVFLENQMLAGR